MALTHATDWDRPNGVAKHTLSILVLDDNAFDRERLRKCASKFAFPTQVDEVDSLYGLEEKLDETAFDAIVIDYNLVAGDGIDALNIISNHPVNFSAARIMLAGVPEYTIAVEAMKHGCDDFIAKSGLNADNLQTTVLEAVLSASQKNGKALVHELEGISNSLANGVAEICLLTMYPQLSQMQHRIAVLKKYGNLCGQDRNALGTIGDSCCVLQDFLRTIEKKNTKSDGRVVSLK